MSAILDVVRLTQETELLEQQAKLRKENGIYFYRPHPKQDKFHRAGEFKFRYARTGNRFGKSDMGAAEMVAWLIGERPWYKEDDDARYAGIPMRSVKMLLVVTDWDKAKEIFTNEVDGNARGKLFKLIPKTALVQVIKNQGGNVIIIRVKSRWGGISELHIDTTQSFKNNQMGSESSDWDGIHVDEPIPRAMWVAVSRGLMDRNGKAWFCCTPINEPWINDFFLPNRRTKLADDEFKSAKKFVIVGTSWDNPYNSEEGMATYFEGLTPEEKECREKGIPAAMAGVVYKEFLYDEHVVIEPPIGWEDMVTPPANYSVRVAIDPHPSTPHAVLFAATAPSGEVYFYYEIFRKLLIRELCDAIKEVLGNCHLVSILCDPLAFIENPVDGTTMADVIMEEGLNIEKAPKDLHRGIIETRQALKERIKYADGVERPKLRFMDTLEETIHEFEHYEWDQKRTDKVIDKNDHFMECLYRLVISGLDYVPAENYTNKYFPLRSIDAQVDLTFIDEPEFVDAL